MTIPSPESFLHVVGTVLMAIAVIFAVATIWAGQPAVRLFAIILVCAMSIISSHWTTYFASIFIIATAITEVGFLEKLAAIIRGSKEYFDYQKELLSTQEARSRATAEAGDVPLEAVTPELAQAVGEAAQAGYAIEQLALSHVERRLGAPAQRNVRFTRGPVAVEFDGVVQGSGGRPDVLVEVKLLPTATIREGLLKAAQLLLRRQQQFHDITGRRSTGRLVVVIPSRVALKDDSRILAQEIATVSHTLQLDIVDFSDIGYQPPA